MELDRIGALSDAFTLDYFKSLIDEATLKLSVKAFLATEQRIPGIGNGVCQDILFLLLSNLPTKTLGVLK